MSTLAEIEAAAGALPTPQQEELHRFLSRRLREAEARPTTPRASLWVGARERLRRIWGERVLSEREVVEMRDCEDDERD